MDIVEHINQLASHEDEYSLKSQQQLLLSYLQELQHLESRLWGIVIKELENGEELVLENANHLLYLVRNNGEEMKDFLQTKEVREFIEELKELREDFLYLKKKIKEKNRLKSLVNLYTLKLVTKNSYPKLEEIFLLEKQLNEVIEVQDRELMELIVDISYLENLTGKEKVEGFIEGIKRIRKILSGHLEHHELWDRERMEFSNASNIISALIVRVKESI